VSETQEILKPTEAAEILRISKSEIYRQMQTGGLPHIAIGKRKLIRREDLEAWIEAHIEKKELK